MLTNLICGPTKLRHTDCEELTFKLCKEKSSISCLDSRNALILDATRIRRNTGYMTSIPAFLDTVPEMPKSLFISRI